MSSVRRRGKFEPVNTVPRLSVDVSDQSVPAGEPLGFQALYQPIKQRRQIALKMRGIPEAI
jgi:hypothetical protein